MVFGGTGAGGKGEGVGVVGGVFHPAIEFLAADPGIDDPLR